MQQVAFVTYRQKQHITADDQLTAEILEKQGIHVQAANWDDKEVSWDKFDKVILRSCWDYHLRSQEFAHWIDLMKRKNHSLYNPCRVIEWNMDKQYLKELSQKGILIPPTIWLEPYTRVNLCALLEDTKWEKAVIKPIVSASAYQTWVTSQSTAREYQPVLNAMLQQGGVMVQQFVKEVQTKGEWSVIFFNKKFSHAVLKRAKKDDFRVQSEFGGTVATTHIPEKLLAQAKAIIDLIDSPLLYARVDGIEVETNFMLIEIELIEPALFLANNRSAPQNFAQAIIDSI